MPGRTGSMRTRSIHKAALTDAVTPLEESGKKLAYKAAVEGIVLLENDGSLPLKAGKIALYGAGAKKTIKGGTGSGEVNERHAVSVFEGLEQSGFTVTTMRWIEDYDQTFEEGEQEYAEEFRKKLSPKNLSDFMNLMSSPYRYPYGRAIQEKDIEESDTDSCIYVVSRQAGEGADRKLDENEYGLSEIERINIAFCAERYKKLIVVINVGGVFDLNFLNEISGINAVIFMGELGTMGGLALADVISGKQTPSGKLTDTWAKHYRDLPFADEYSYLNGYYEVFRNMFQIVDDKCLDDNMDELASKVDVIFTATPQGLCSSLVSEEILSKVKIIDLSADFRIKDVNRYEEWYGIKHQSPEFIDEAVYGLCEINREDIKKARLIANPGCYPTCSTLSIYPMAKEGLIEMNSVIIDAKSGTSGAGRGAKVNNLYCEVNENIKAYGVATHRHTPEIEDQLSYASGEEVLLNFTPHLIPMNRGILVTAYATLKKDVSYEEVKAIYDSYYKNEKFVRVLDKDVCPETRWVEGSNYVDVNFKIDKRTNRIIMMGAMDNLVKGAAGQAVQNMNLMFGLKETEGLELVPMFP